jgi:hypothetical protein
MLREAREEWHCATRYANRLLDDLGVPRLACAAREPHPALRWAQSGSMALTGNRDGPPQMCPVPLASYADGIIAALRSFRPASALGGLDGAQLLAERAALAHYRRAGATAAGGGCRLLPVADGWLAVNLARANDWEMLPAWLEAGAITDWDGVAGALRSRTLSDALSRARLMGLAVAPLAPPVTGSVPWCRELYRSQRAQAARVSPPLVVDLSSLWAGPLCAHLLQMMDARVIKVESLSRPDGMRDGASAFYHLLNAGKSSVALDFGDACARARLRELLLRADIVIEASRPRALRQLGILAEEILEQHPGMTWIAISGYGREEPAANWIAYGDDAAVAAGLSHILRDCSGLPLFCGDAVADPLTGLHAALAAWCSFAQGGGRLLSLALRDVVAHGIGFAALADGAASRERAAQWSRGISGGDVAAPRARPIAGRARALGADTAEILSGRGVACFAGGVH